MLRGSFQMTSFGVHAKGRTLLVDVKLIIFKPGGGQKEVELKGGRYVIGRQSGATLQIPLPSVSREHCELLVRDDALHVRDMGSSNGTFRNDDRVTEATLEAGDYLRVGELSIGVQINGEPAQIAPPASAAGSAESSMAQTPAKPFKALDDSAEGAATTPMGSGQANGGDENDASGSASADALLESFGMDESSMIDLDIDLDDSNAPQL